MASNTPRSSETTLIHPFETIHPDNIRDALDDCVATLPLLTQHFISEDDYNPFDSACVRRGMFLQLQGVANTLEAIEAFLGREAEEASKKREAEREAEREARREAEERIAADPETIAKQIALSKAFAHACNIVLFDGKREVQQPADAEPQND